jgi:two-component system, NtrC family, sensor histidine kinase HydH
MDAFRLSSYRGSVVRRYSLLLVASAILPMAVVGLVYDRYARSLLEEFTGERIRGQLAATASRVGSFLEARTYQLETIATYPAPPSSRPGVALASLVRIEADAADLYGILFFSDRGALVRAIAGQAAAGPPYWSAFDLDLATMPRQVIGETSVIGPVPPREGQSGWFLLQQRFRGGGTVALQVRLASVTELMGSTSAAEVVRPFLRTPAGDFDARGLPTTIARGEIVVGPEVLPGWRPCLVVDPDELLRPFQAARVALLLASIFAAGAIAWLVATMAGKLKRRVDLLAHGAEVVAGGDFTHRVQLEGDDEISLLAKTFNRMASRLGLLIERTVRMKRLSALGEFSTGVAHEVRNPLATLKTTVQALARVEKDAERSALLASMLQEIDRMGRAMQEILVFGRPRLPKQRELALAEVIPGLVGLAAPEAAQQGVSLVVEGDLGVVAVVDPDHLAQILLNLLQNALQASSSGDRIVIQVSADESQAVVEVRDTGPGIAPEKLAHVFEPFFTTKRGGTGLGLSISRQLAELNGGGLVLESTVGQGTTARVTLRPKGRAHVEHLDH